MSTPMPDTNSDAGRVAIEDCIPVRDEMGHGVAVIETRRGRQGEIYRWVVDVSGWYYHPVDNATTAFRLALHYGAIGPVLPDETKS